MAMTSTLLLTVEKQNLETYSLIWLDASANSSRENIRHQQQLQIVINQLKVFEDSNECEEYIRQVSKDDRLVLIVSDRFGPIIVPRIHQLRQVFSIYIYCVNNEPWTTHFSKVKAVSAVFDELIDKIRADRNQRQHTKNDETLPISIFTTSAGPEQSTTGINGHFIHSQLLLHCLVQMQSNTVDKTELISVCKKQYEGVNEELKLLEDFEEHYSPSHALWWYTRQSCLYRLLNKALRTENIDLLFSFRFFIRDIEQQLENNKCTASIRVYRGQLISKEEMNVLQKSVGELISVNSFLSTSLNRALALQFIAGSDSSNELQRVFFEIDADPQLETIKPFSNITSHSYFPGEEEILFMIGSIFQLVDIDCNSDGIWLIGMKLCAGNNHHLQSLFDHMRDEHNNEQNTLLSFCDILYKMGKYDDAEKCSHRLLEDRSSDHKYLARCYHTLGKISKEKDDLDSSLVWLHKSLEINLQTLGPNDPAVADIYNTMGNTYRKRDDLPRAIEMFEKALAIWRITLNDDSLELVKYYSDIGNVYLRQTDFSRALEYHLKALNINEQHLPKYHSYLGSSHLNIATVYRHLGNYDLSLEHAQLALHIFQKSLPSEHSRIGWTFENLGLVYEKQGKLQQSLTALDTAINIYRQTLPKTHFYITDIQRNIDRVSSQLK